MKIIIIGGTGHIGTYLTPALANAGHEVECVSRRQRKPYQKMRGWESVRHLTIDREKAEKDGSFGDQIRELEADVVIDLICFTPESARQLVEALLGNVKHFIHCGTMWVHGHSECVPTTEKQDRKPFGEYGSRKAKIEAYLLDLYQKHAFPATVLHPGHITGPGWLPINPAGNLDPEIFVKLAEGKTVTLPHFGMETVHHVHAFDVAQAFVNAINNREQSVGESFHIVSEQAHTLRGFAMAVASWYGKEARLSFLPWEEWKKNVSKRDAELTYDHIAHSPNGSIAKANKLINYQPKYSSLEAVREAINYYFDQLKP